MFLKPSKSIKATKILNIGYQRAVTNDQIWNQDVKPKLETNNTIQSPNQDPQDMDFLWNFKINIDSQTSENGSSNVSLLVENLHISTNDQKDSIINLMGIDRLELGNLVAIILEIKSYMKILPHKDLYFKAFAS